MSAKGKDGIGQGIVGLQDEEIFRLKGFHIRI